MQPKRKTYKPSAVGALVLSGLFMLCVPKGTSAASLVIDYGSLRQVHIDSGILQQIVGRIQSACGREPVDLLSLGGPPISEATPGVRRSWVHPDAADLGDVVSAALTRSRRVWLVTGSAYAPDDSPARRFYDVLRSQLVRQVELFAVRRPNDLVGPLVYAISAVADDVLEAQIARFATATPELRLARVSFKPLVIPHLQPEYEKVSVDERFARHVAFERRPSVRVKVGEEFRFRAHTPTWFLPVGPETIRTRPSADPPLGDRCLVEEKRSVRLSAIPGTPGRYSVEIDFGVVRLRSTWPCHLRTVFRRSANHAAVRLPATPVAGWGFSSSFVEEFGARTQQESAISGGILGLENIPAALLPDAVQLWTEMPVRVHVDYSPTHAAVGAGMALFATFLILRRRVLLKASASGATLAARVRVYPGLNGWLEVVCVAIAIARFGREVVLSPTQYGDFFLTFPGEYAADFNPTLWNSPDLRDSWAYHTYTYTYGPIQYLTLLPLVFLDSYQQIDTFLRIAYVGVIAVSVWAIWKTVSFGEPRTTSCPLIFALIVAAAALFFPLIQAYSHREFEVVLFALVTLVFCLAARGRFTGAGAALGYATWFKYWPMVLVAAFVLQRRLKAVFAFCVASALTLMVAHGVLGIQHFLHHDVRLLATGKLAWLIPAADMCADVEKQIRSAGRVLSREQADLRWGLCGIGGYIPGMPVPIVYFAIVWGLAGLLAYGCLHKPAVEERERKWRILWELSLLVIAGVTFFYANLYYLGVLLWPISCLIFRYANHRVSMRVLKAGILAVCYALLSVFVVPRSLFERFGVDVMGFYMGYGIYVYGLVGLLLLVSLEYYACLRTGRFGATKQ